MTFIHGYLLAGLVLLGVPVVIHLLNRQKPEPMPFPAFRFLKLKRSTNRRRMRLQNLLLLLARLLVLTLLILALARPQITGARTPLSGNQPVQAVFVFDTSLSMDYSAGESHLDQARTRAREVLAKIAPESKVHVLETGEWIPPLNSKEGWLQGRTLVEGRLASLRTRPVVESLPRLIEAGVGLLKQAALEETQPQLLVVFSDRTTPSWPVAPAAVKKLVPNDVEVLFVDIGVDAPRDLGIESIETRPPLVVPGARLEVRIAVRAVGSNFNTVLHCQFENDPETDPAQTRQQVNLGEGERKVYVFQRAVPPRPADAPEAPIQIVARLDGSDPLPFNNLAYATVPARNQRRLLLIADSASASRPVRVALEAIAKDRPAEAFSVTAMASKKAAELTPAELQEYGIVLLHQVILTDAPTWDKLGSFVENGGGLIIVPPGDEIDNQRPVFNEEGKRVQLLPAALQQVVQVPAGQPGVVWKDFRNGHPLTTPLRSWFQVSDPQVVSYWEVDPTGNEAGVIATYAGKEERPALVERRRGRGRVLLFTVPLDGRELQDGRAWHNYWKESAFGLVLLDLACQDLAGRISVPSLRFPRGHEVRLSVPRPSPQPPYKLTGPGLSESETRIAWSPPPNAGADAALPDLVLSQATAAGNFQVRDAKDRIFAAFSLTEPFEENNLTRVPVETIEAALGEKSVLPVGFDVELKDRIAEKFTPPTELVPLVLLALLLLMAVESWLANRFYKPDPAREEQAANLRPTGELTRARV